MRADHAEDAADAPRRLIDDRPPPRSAGQHCAAQAAGASYFARSAKSSWAPACDHTKNVAIQRGFLTIA